MSGRLVPVHRANILNATALSAETAPIDDARIVAIQMPAAWTAASLTFQARIGVLIGVATGGAQDVLGNVFDSDGVEVTVSAAAGQYVVLTPSEAEALAACRILKVRSGTSGTPVNQGADRELILIGEPR